MTRAGWIMASAVGTMLLLTPAVIPMPNRLLWNVSASVPVGLYAVRPVGTLGRGMLVVTTPPEPLSRFLARRGYLPRGVPLLKHVAALPGQRICRQGGAVSIDGRIVAIAQQNDRIGRPLPRWSGCGLVGPREVFLLNSGVPDSLDGRYFGVLPRRSIIGRAQLLWTRSGPEFGNPPANERTIP